MQGSSSVAAVLGGTPLMPSMFFNLLGTFNPHNARPSTTTTIGGFPVEGTLQATMEVAHRSSWIEPTCLQLISWLCPALPRYVHVHPLPWISHVRSIYSQLGTKKFSDALHALLSAGARTQTEDVLWAPQPAANLFTFCP